MPPSKTPADHRQAITRALRYLEAPTEVCTLILDNFDCGCKAAKAEGYGDCAAWVLAMANSLAVYGNA